MTAGAAHPIRYWVRRYLPNELVGTGSALAGAGTALALTGSLVVAAIVGTLAETIGFYSVAVARIRLEERRRTTGAAPVALRTAIAAAVEYGPAELLDTALVRPALLLIGPVITAVPVLGWILGKVAADVVFYVVAAVSRTALERRRAASVDVTAALPPP